MNYRMIAGIVGRVVALVGALMLLPTAVALYYGESVKGFLAVILMCAVIAAAVMIPTKTKNKQIYAKEGFVCVALSWLAVSALGALPFVIEGEIPNYVDAFFEIVSGFTTTGSSILTNVEEMSRGLLFWRSFTHWIGGMGIIVLMMALLPVSEQNSMHMMRAEVPGHEAGKLVPKVQRSSLILYLIYCGLSAAEVIALLIGKMPLYDAVVHTFGTAGTGGFGIKSLSIGYYNSAYIDIVIGIFMMLFGINFNLYFFLLMRKFRLALKNEELLLYLGLITFSTVTIAANISSMYGGFLNSLRYSFFQVSSIITTTGFSTADFNLWPEYSRTLLVLLMFVGACAGSTGGGIKVSRLIILFKASRSEVRRLLRPRSYNSTTFCGEPVESGVVRRTLVFFALYIVITFFSCLLISLENFDASTTITSVVACISNIGPGLGMVGPMGSFADFSWASKLLLSMCMLVGRLEIFPMLMLFAPSTWKKSSRF